MRYLLCTFFLLLLCAQSNKACAQNTVVGQVVNMDGEAIRSVKINKDGTDEFVYTNRSGQFVLQHQGSKLLLEISHVGFDTLYEAVNFDRDTVRLNIVLRKSTRTFSELTIRSAYEEVVYHKRNVSVIDYVPISKGLLLLAKRKRTYQLKWLDESFHGISEVTLPFKAKALFKDCLGELHVLSNDSSYQIELRKDSTFDFYHAHHLYDFATLLLPCTGATEKGLFFKNEIVYNQELFYTTIAREDGSRKLVKHIYDQEAADQIRNYKHRIDTNPAPPRYAEIYPGKFYEEAKDKAEDILWLNEMLIHPTYHPMFQFKDSVFIYDHLNNECTVYNSNDSLSRSFPIEHQLLYGWKNELLADQNAHKCYARLEMKGQLYLFDISTQNGEVLNKHRIEKKTFFPEKLKVYEGYAYYIYNYNGKGFFKLYRQKLA